MPNMELITSVTVGSGGAASVTLPGTGTIPQTYTDLLLQVSSRNTAVDTENTFSFNGSSANFSIRRIFGNGSTTGSDTLYGYSLTTTSGYTANTFSNNSIYIPNYTSSNFKSISIDGVAENNATASAQVLSAALWSNTAAITSIRLQPTSGTYAEGSTFYLYGISSVTSTPKATGGIVSQDATHWYHMFPFSSTFTPTAAISADILMVAGGGAGGYYYGAGGGAGGLQQLTNQSLTTQSYTIGIGAGGVSTTAYPGVGASGTNTTFTGQTASVGGGGGSGTASGSLAGGNGGSGGGAGGISAGSNGGTPTSGQGFAGGASPQGGGGGAGGAGASNTAGIGATSALINAMAAATNTGERSGSNYYFAGGGGGGGTGTGGLGGGGRAGDGSGLPNTGGGCGGDIASNLVRSGGSGIVIVRYAK
jgi:hypothetical protein